MEILVSRWLRFSAWSICTIIDIFRWSTTYGSLGASGDLAPLAHMSLPLLGMGEVV